VDAQPGKGFNFPYVLRLPAEPESARKALLVETNNTGLDDDPAHEIEAVRAFVTNGGVGPFVAAALQVPLLVPVFPRPKSTPLLYTHALDRDSILIRDGPLRRIDNQLLHMIEDARERLARRNLVVPEAVFMCGFSASGSFANRFAFLHPDKVLGVAVGGINALPMAPIARRAGRVLRFPLGIADLDPLTEGRADLPTWRKVPQMIFMGTLDDNDAAKFSDAYSDDERRTITVAFGAKMDARWQTLQQIYLEQKPAVTFVTYGGVGHGTDGRINRDVANFFDSILRKREAAASAHP
jgi:pimeloyl-ACP methyl ester carboxylesterase